MAKPSKRLSLKVETLRTLAGAELEHVAGGAAGITSQLTKITTQITITSSRTVNPPPTVANTCGSAANGAK